MFSDLMTETDCDAKWDFFITRNAFKKRQG